MIFKYYDSQDDEIVEYTEKITFTNNMIIGDGFTCVGAIADEKNDKLYWLVTSDDIDAIIEYDNIIVMKNGEIVEQGNHEFLLNQNGVYKKLYEIETLKSNEKD